MIFLYVFSNYRNISHLLKYKTEYLFLNWRIKHLFKHDKVCKISDDIIIKK